MAPQYAYSKLVLEPAVQIVLDANGSFVFVNECAGAERSRYEPHAPTWLAFDHFWEAYGCSYQLSSLVLRILRCEPYLVLRQEQ